MKNKFVIIFYTKPDGTDLIKAFLDDLPVKLRVKAYGALALLEEYGNEIREPYSKHIRNGLFELRIKFSSDNIRLFYFFDHGQKIIVVNGYVKKDDKLKNALILSSLQIMNDYRIRKKE
ncbi:MAG: type II toxin-antitoxin system RelE/ParE family toxin [Bacillota bacterium]|nr:type II toxin-antitoxin system RelE/ParE family toxin [Bacillota bacterium]